MKKIPTLFKREFKDSRIVSICEEITPGCEDAFYNGIATVKIDGSCCAVINGLFYKRYDAKNGKQPPEGAIPCCEPDLITGHWPHWVKVDLNNPSDKWYIEAFTNTDYYPNLRDGTYEAVGPHFQSNPYDAYYDHLVEHGSSIVEIERDYEHIKEYLENENVEGLVFWLNDEPVCKIKKSDFGFSWNKRK